MLSKDHAFICSSHSHLQGQVGNPKMMGFPLLILSVHLCLDCFCLYLTLTSGARMCSCKPQWAKVRESELDLGIERKPSRVKVPSGCFTVVNLSSLGKV